MTKLEMCYDGALVMPSNYAVMNEEEMTYVEGAWDFRYRLSRYGITLTFTGSISDMAWIAAAGFALGATIVGVLTPSTGPIVAYKASATAFAIAALAATIVATNDWAVKTKFTISKYVGL